MEDLYVKKWMILSRGDCKEHSDNPCKEYSKQLDKLKKKVLTT
jgi:hypothetical protein